MQFISKVPNGGLVESKFFAERTSAKTKLGKFPNQKCKANRTGDTEHLPTAHTVKISNCSSHIDIVHMEKDNMLKRNWLGDPACYFCSSPESRDHLFFQCPISKVVWGVIGTFLGAYNIPRDITQYDG